MPKPLVKPIVDILETGPSLSEIKKSSDKHANYPERVIRKINSFREVKDLTKYMESLEKEMIESAKALDFEKAAGLRDLVKVCMDRLKLL